AKKVYPHYTGTARKFSSKGYHSSNIGYSVQAGVLPYFGRAELFETFSESYADENTKLWVWLGFIEEASKEAAQTVIPAFRCPADSPVSELNGELSAKQGLCGDGRNSPVACGNYVACNGSGTGYNYDHTVLNDGMVSKKVQRTAEMIPDGTVNTLLFSEAILGDGSRYNNTPNSLKTPWARTATKEQNNITYRGDTDWLAGVPGIEGVYADRSFDLPTHVTNNVDDWFGLRGFSWIIGDSYSTGFTTFSSPNPPYPDWCDTMGIGFFAARSFHAGGVNAACVDGSVRFVSDSVAVPNWHRMGSRNDNVPELP
ncbi:MAG: DUF1559 domain-containing protein, partial [Planctomycetaceae bacterium]|nr:DUF1559 domain-containing protein [Planctomycetaceae bacterium]